MKRYSLIAATGLALAMPAMTTPAHAEDYDMDCKLILCLVGGFPSGCSDAYSYMIGRLKKFKPPIGVCTMSDGDGYDNLDTNAHFISGKASYYCESPKKLYYREEERDGQNDRITAFCYTKAVTKRVKDDGEWVTSTIYQGKSTPERYNFYVHVTVEPGTAEEYSSPEYLVNTGTGNYTEIK
jgi:hypothetical protein